MAYDEARMERLIAALPAAVDALRSGHRIIAPFDMLRELNRSAALILKMERRKSDPASLPRQSATVLPFPIYRIRQ